MMPALVLATGLSEGELEAESLELGCASAQFLQVGLQLDERSSAGKDAAEQVHLKRLQALQTQRSEHLHKAETALQAAMTSLEASAALPGAVSNVVDTVEGAVEGAVGGVEGKAAAVVDGVSTAASDLSGVASDSKELADWAVEFAATLQKDLQWFLIAGMLLTLCCIGGWSLCCCWVFEETCIVFGGYFGFDEHTCSFRKKMEAPDKPPPVLRELMTSFPARRKDPLQWVTKPSGSTCGAC